MITDLSLHTKGTTGGEDPRKNISEKGVASGRGRAPKGELIIRRSLPVPWTV